MVSNHSSSKEAEERSIDLGRRHVLLTGAGVAVSSGCIAGQFPPGGVGVGGGGGGGAEGTPPGAPGGGGASNCKPAASNKDGQRVVPLNTCQPDHPRHPGPVTAMGWSHNVFNEGNFGKNVEGSANSIGDFESVGFTYLGVGADYGGKAHTLKEKEVDKAVEWLGKWPEGRRGFTLFGMPKIFSNIFGKRDHRDAPIIGTLAEDVGGEKRSSITVEPLPTDLMNSTNSALLTYKTSKVPLKSEYENVFFTAEPAPKGATEVKVKADRKDDSAAKVYGKKGDPIVLAGAQSMWPYHSVRTTQLWMDKICKKVKENDLTLDYLIMDNETTFITQKGFSYKSMKADPRWNDPAHGFEGRSIAEMAEAKDWNGALEGDDEKAFKWAFKMLSEFAYDWAVYAGIVAPAKEYFPEVKASDWENIGLTVDSRSLIKGTQTPSQAGTHSATNFYARGGSSPNSQLSSTVNYLRTVRKFTNGDIQPWIGWKGAFAGGAFNAGVRNNYMYEEMVRHVALHEPEPILYFVYQRSGSWSPKQDRILDAVMTEVNDELGGGYSLATEFVPSRGENWQDGPGGGPGWSYNTSADKLDDGDVNTGVKLEDGSALWRLSCRRFGVKDDNSLPEDSGPVEITIKAGGSEVDTATIPGGKGGVWWRHDDPDADLSFAYSYPESEVQRKG